MGRPGKRHHLGTGRLAREPAKSVFINCPFDADFRPLFDAIVFSTVCCGFVPRCAVESGTIADARLERIVRAIETSRYSIHDLSRCRGEGDANLAKFNMPLELGMAMAQRLGRSPSGRRHDWLLLVPRGHLYGRFLSDHAGYDPTEHDGNEATIVPAVMAWLATRPDAVATPTPQTVLAALPTFRAEREALGVAWLGREPWADLLLMAERVGREAGLIEQPSG